MNKLVEVTDKEYISEGMEKGRFEIKAIWQGCMLAIVTGSDGDGHPTPMAVIRRYDGKLCARDLDSQWVDVYVVDDEQ